MERITIQEMRKLSHNFQVRFALFCAYQVQDKWKSIPEAIEVIEAVRVVELWLEGKASGEECRMAYTSTSAASYAAGAAYAAHAAYTSASAASYAAHAAHASVAAYAADYNAGYAGASKTKVIKEQWDFYNELLHFDEIVEKALLGEEV